MKSYILKIEKKRITCLIINFIKRIYDEIPDKLPKNYPIKNS